MKNTYYIPSGKCSVAFFMYYPLFMATAIPVASLVYVYIVHYVPFIYLNAFFTIIFGTALGYVMDYASKFGKARNPTVVFICTLAAACAAYYIQWCVYIPLVFSDSFKAFNLSIGEQLLMSMELLIEPDQIYEMACIIYNEGVLNVSAGRSSTSIELKGFALLIIWVLEFIIIVVAAHFVSKRKSGFPFSEEINEWYTEMPVKIETNMPEDFNTIKNNMERGNFDRLVQLIKDEKIDSPNSLFLTFYQPPSPSYSREPYYLSINNINVTTDKKGKETKKDKALLKYLTIDNEIMRKLTQNNQHI